MSTTRVRSAQLLPLDPTSYRPHPIHSAGRTWAEVNCYVDLWVELLHSIGLDPVPGLCFSLSAGFEGDQWRFLKFPPEDLRDLYGIEVVELNPWRGTEQCIADHLALGHLLTVEVDSWYLPDTAGVSYRQEHVKTTITPNSIDAAERRLEYFHGAGYHELSGDDYLGLLPAADGPTQLLPYVELIRLDAVRPLEGDALLAATVVLAARHLGRAPKDNPVYVMRRRLELDRSWLTAGGMDRFHGYAFATLRQCGAGAELAADLCRWLAAHGEATTDAIGPFLEVAAAAKTAQFNLARLCAGRSAGIDGPLDQMEHSWDVAMASVGDLVDR